MTTGWVLVEPPLGARLVALVAIHTWSLALAAWGMKMAPCVSLNADGVDRPGLLGLIFFSRRRRRQRWHPMLRWRWPGGWPRERRRGRETKRKQIVPMAL
jgi:hypothetical protein